MANNHSLSDGSPIRADTCQVVVVLIVASRIREDCYWVERDRNMTTSPMLEQSS